jgi:hypothetical protein
MIFVKGEGVARQGPQVAVESTRREPPRLVDDASPQDARQTMDPEAALSHLFRGCDVDADATATPALHGGPRRAATVSDNGAQRHDRHDESPAVPPAVRQLVQAFFSEVDSRLPSRIRDLAVDFTRDGSIVLHGRCSSYYVKQVVQHIGMTLLTCGRLINKIQVYPPR